MPAAVFIAVRDDHGNGAVRPAFRESFLAPGNFADGIADRVQQGCAAAGDVVPRRERPDVRDRLPVMDHLHPVVEENRCDHRFPLFLFLLFQEAVVPADGVGLQSVHGTAAVDNEDDFCHFVHVLSSLFTCIIPVQGKEKVAVEATFIPAGGVRCSGQALR